MVTAETGKITYLPAELIISNSFGKEQAVGLDGITAEQALLGSARGHFSRIERELSGQNLEIPDSWTTQDILGRVLVAAIEGLEKPEGETTYRFQYFLIPGKYKAQESIYGVGFRVEQATGDKKRSFAGWQFLSDCPNQFLAGLPGLLVEETFGITGGDGTGRGLTITDLTTTYSFTPAGTEMIGRLAEMITREKQK